ncbi:hypothetical protein Tco_0358656, partial [Tanacetum coccineum]
CGGRGGDRGGVRLSGGVVMGMIMMLMMMAWCGLSRGSSRMEGEGRLWWRRWGGDRATAEGWRRRWRRVVLWIE